MTIESKIKSKTCEALLELYNFKSDSSEISLQQTRKEFSGDFTIVVFPFLKASAKSPQQTADEIGNYLLQNLNDISEFNVIKGFLNLSISDEYWLSFLNKAVNEKDFGLRPEDENSENVMVEFSSPNTNKPLHLGHIRNILLGDSIAKILKACGKSVMSVNLVNDRGIHICKSMIAWQKWGNNITPEKSGKKGDKLVGDYYVKFDQEYKKELENLISSGVDPDTSKNDAPVMQEARDMLIKWEAGDKEIHSVWEMMNSWVYSGFDETYDKLGVKFDKIYYESETYKLGKEIVLQGLEDGNLIRKDDSSVWADLSEDGLDEKILLRADGTSVYMTQDIGTAHQRFEGFKIDRHIYVVGNEQNYHFQVLKIILEKLGYDWAKAIYHLSYGMVELPGGKMKSREGTVVDADDLIDEMINTATEISKEQGKLDGMSNEEIKSTISKIALAALKYFILKVDPKKNMTFMPEESIDFNGNTGPFIQYTYARTRSILRKAEEKNISFDNHVEVSTSLNTKEQQLLKNIYLFRDVIEEAGNNLSPAIIANYVYELAKDYNQFYHEFGILTEEDKGIRNLRILISAVTGNTIKSALSLLGIDVPEKM